MSKYNKKRSPKKELKEEMAKLPKNSDRNPRKKTDNPKIKNKATLALCLVVLRFWMCIGREEVKRLRREKKLNITKHFFTN